MNFEFFEDLPNPVKIIIFILPILIILAISYKFLFSPHIKKINVLKVEADKLGKEVRAFQQIVDEYNATKDKVKKDIEEKEAVVKTKIPSEENLPILLEELARVAILSRLTDISFPSPSPATATPATSSAQTPASKTEETAKKEASPSQSIPSSFNWKESVIKISFYGQYRDLALFLDEISRLSRFVVIDSIEIKRSVPLISVDVVIRTFYSQGVSVA